MKTRIKELENLLKEKDNIIHNLENERKEFLNKNKKLKIEYNNLNEKLNKWNQNQKRIYQFEKVEQFFICALEDSYIYLKEIIKVSEEFYE